MVFNFKGTTCGEMDCHTWMQIFTTHCVRGLCVRQENDHTLYFHTFCTLNISINILVTLHHCKRCVSHSFSNQTKETNHAFCSISARSFWRCEQEEPVPEKVDCTNLHADSTTTTEKGARCCSVVVQLQLHSNAFGCIQQGCCCSLALRYHIQISSLFQWILSAYAHQPTVCMCVCVCVLHCSKQPRWSFTFSHIQNKDGYHWQITIDWCFSDALFKAGNTSCFWIWVVNDSFVQFIKEAGSSEFAFAKTRVMWFFLSFHQQDSLTVCLFFHPSWNTPHFWLNWRKCEFLQLPLFLLRQTIRIHATLTITAFW